MNYLQAFSVAEPVWPRIVVCFMDFEQELIVTEALIA
jgi:hypothetical protein